MIIRTSIFHKSPLELVDSFNASVEYTQYRIRHITGRGSMRLVDYTYYLILNCSSCERRLEVEYDVYRIFYGKTGSVFVEKYYRTQAGMFEYPVVSWTVNNPES